MYTDQQVLGLAAQLAEERQLAEASERREMTDEELARQIEDYRRSSTDEREWPHHRAHSVRVLNELLAEKRRRIPA